MIPDTSEERVEPPDLTGWAQDKMRRLAERRARAYRPRILPGNQRRERETVEAEIDDHRRAFAPELGIPKQWVTGAPAEPLPDGVARMPAGLTARQQEAWRVEQRAGFRPRATVDAAGTVRDLEGNAVVSADGRGVAKVTPRGRRSGWGGFRGGGDVQWRAEDGIFYDGSGRALHPQDVDTRDPQAADLAKEIRGDPFVKADLGGVAQKQKEAALADDLEEATRRHLAMIEEGMPVDAGEQLKRIKRNAGEYLPMSTAGLMKMLTINGVIKKDQAWQAWYEGGRKGAEPEAVSRFEEAKLNEYLADQQLQREMGATFGAKASEGVARLFPYMAEMALGGGLAGGAKQAAGKAARRAAAGAVGRSVAGNALGRGALWAAKSRLARAAGRLAVDATARTLINPQQFAEDYIRRRLPQGELAAGADGGLQRAYTPGQSQREAFRNTLGERWANYFGEGVGDEIGAAIKAAKPGWSGTKAGRVLLAAGESPAAKWADKMRWSGLPLEALEEQVTRGMTEAFGVDLTPQQRKEPVGKRVSRTIPSKEDMLVELGVLLVPTVGIEGGGKLAGWAAGRAQRAAIYRETLKERERRQQGQTAMRSAVAMAGVEPDAFAANLWRARNGEMAEGKALFADAERLREEVVRVLSRYGDAEKLTPADLAPGDRELVAGLAAALRLTGQAEAAGEQMAATEVPPPDEDDFDFPVPEEQPAAKAERILAQAADGELVAAVVDGKAGTAPVVAVAQAEAARREGEAGEHRAQQDRNYTRILQAMNRTRAKMNATGATASMPDLQVLVTFGKDAGRAPAGVYKDLRDLGLQRQEARGMVVKAWPNFGTAGKGYGEVLTLSEAVRDLGGIAPFKNKTPGTSQLHKDYAGVPLWLRNKGGLAIDVMVENLKEFGFHFETPDELAQALEREVGKMDVNRDPTKRVEDEAPDYEDWEENDSEWINVADLKPGMTWWMMNDQYEVQAVGETGVRVLNRRLGIETVVTHALTARLRINTGSLSEPEPVAAPVVAAPAAAAKQETPAAAAPEVVAPPKEAASPAETPKAAAPKPAPAAMDHFAHLRRKASSAPGATELITTTPTPKAAKRGVMPDARGRKVAAGAPTVADYFKQTDRAREVLLAGMIVTKREPAKSVNNAVARLEASRAGKGDKRAPLDVVDNKDGTFTVLDGNATVLGLRRTGMDKALAHVNELEQPSLDVAELVRDGAAALPQIEALLAALTARVGGKVEGVRLKPAESIERKLKDYGHQTMWTASRVLDVVAGTVSFESEAKVKEALETLLGDGVVVRAKDRFTRPVGDDGYRDVLLNLRLPGGHIYEVQLTSEAMYWAKKHGGHKAYKARERIKEMGVSGKRDKAVAEEQDRKIGELMHAFYGFFKAPAGAERLPINLAAAKADSRVIALQLESMRAAASEGMAGPIEPSAKTQNRLPSGPVQSAAPVSSLSQNVLSAPYLTSGRNSYKDNATPPNETTVAQSTPAVNPSGALSDADQARMRELQEKIRAKLKDATVRETAATYGGRRVVPPRRGVVREAAAGALDAETVTLGAELAGLYVKQGTTTFGGFAAAVQRDMPDVWDGMRRYLHGLWNLAYADHPHIEEVTRKQADETLAALQTGVTGGSVEAVGDGAAAATPGEANDARKTLQGTDAGAPPDGDGGATGAAADQSIQPPGGGGAGESLRGDRPGDGQPGVGDHGAPRGTGALHLDSSGGKRDDAGAAGGGSPVVGVGGGVRGAQRQHRGGRGSGGGGANAGSTGAAAPGPGRGGDALGPLFDSLPDQGGAVGGAGGAGGSDAGPNAGGGSGLRGALQPGGDSGTAGADARVGQSDAGGREAAGSGRVRVGAPGSVAANYRLAGNEGLGGGAVSKARGNIAAIRVLKRVQAEGRAATPEEQAELAAYIGWGRSDLANRLFPTSKDVDTGDTLSVLAGELRTLLTPDEYETARRSTQYAHYTGYEVIRQMWAAAQRLGFAGGRVLEPGSGVGRFVGMVPEALAAATRFTGVEMDGVSAGIARLLYPAADMQHADFTKFPHLGEVFDLVLGNPPFSDRRVDSDPRYAGEKLVLHDYFIRKAIDQLKPGGLAVLVTSHGTMDKQSDTARAMIARHADLIGAIRLPDNAFKADAGTEVVTDILFLRKRFPGVPATGAQWRTLAEVDAGDGKAWVNEYYAAHPEMVLGQHTLGGKMRFGGGQEYTVEAPAGELGAALARAVERLPEQKVVEAPVSKPDTGADDGALMAVLVGDQVDGGFFFDATTGNIFLKEKGGADRVVPRTEQNAKRKAMRQAAATGAAAGAAPDAAADDEDPPGQITKTKEQMAMIRHYVPLRDALRRVLALQRNGTDAELALAQKAMKSAYDTWKMAHGLLNRSIATERVDEDGDRHINVRRPVQDAIREDAFWGAVMALESIDDDNKVLGMSALFTDRVIGTLPARKIESPADALTAVMDDLGKPDVAAAASLLGMDEEKAADALAGLVWRDPVADGKWTLSAAYLSGNVKEKLAVARAAVERDPRYARNVEALEKVQPEDLPPSRIRLNLGMTLIPTADIEQFLKETDGAMVRVTYAALLGRWAVAGGHSRGTGSITRFGTARVPSQKILEAVLNGRPVEVKDRDAVSKKDVINQAATVAANQKVDEMRAAWDVWVTADSTRLARLVRLFNDTLNVWHNEPWSGEHLRLPGLSAKIKLFPHQSGLVWRALQLGNTYAVHEVGLGKTFAAVAMVMEYRRLGMARKPVIMVPNHMLAQWNRDILEAYPAARVLLADEENFDKRHRQRFFGRMASGDYDAIVVTHSAAKMIPLSPERERGFVEAEIAAFREVLESMPGGGKGNKKTRDVTRKQIENKIEKLEERLKTLSKMKRDAGLKWDDLGIDMIVVDEAHEYRKLRFATTRQMKGIDPDGSQKAWDLFMKTRLIQDATPGRGLLFLSGTPVVNTMGEVFGIQRFLQPQALAAANLRMFDAWASSFALPHTGYEKSAGSDYGPVTRLSHWTNMTMLSGMWSQIADYRRFDDLPHMVGKRPELETGKYMPLVVPESVAQRFYRQNVLDPRIAKIKQRHGPPQPGDDIILSVITDAIHAALDERFIQPGLGNNPDSKLERAIENILRIYRDGKADKRTQIVFMDKGLPDMLDKRGFSSYLRMREGLIAGGIPAHEIVFAQGIKSKADKERMQDQMNSGAVRVLIGSMQAMGTGLNVQVRLYAAHLITVPWYPALVEQAVGRILRQGNSYAKLKVPVQVIPYMTAGTIEEFMWGLNETKSRWIEGFYRGNTDEMGGELDSESDQYALLRTLSSADPRVAELAEQQGKLSKIMMLERAHLDQQLALTKGIASLEAALRYREGLLEDMRAINSVPDTRGEKFSMRVGDTLHDKRETAGGALLAAAAGVWQGGNETLQTIGAFGDGRFNVATSRTFRFNTSDGKQAAVVLNMRRSDTGRDVTLWQQVYSNDNPATAKGVIASLEYALGNARDNVFVKRIAEDLANDTAQLAEMRKNNVPWTRGAEAEELRHKIRALQAELAKAANAAAAAPVNPNDPHAGHVAETAARYGGGRMKLLARLQRGQRGILGSLKGARRIALEGLLGVGSRAQGSKHDDGLAGKSEGATGKGGILPPARGGPAGHAALYLSAASRGAADHAEDEVGAGGQAGRVSEGRGVAAEGLAPELAERVRAVGEAVRGQFADPSSAAAGVAVRETVTQLGLALSISDAPYLPTRYMPRLMPAPSRANARMNGQMERKRADDAAHQLRVRRAFADWKPETLRDVMGQGEGTFYAFMMDRIINQPEVTNLVLDVPSNYRIDSPRDAAALMMPIRVPHFESFKVIALDDQQRVLSACVRFVGLLDASLVHPREVFSELPPATHSIIISHNHPSGDPRPSSEDVALTRRLADVGEMLGIPLADHVVTNGGWFSLRNAKMVWLPPETSPYSNTEESGAAMQSDPSDEQLARFEIVNYLTRMPVRTEDAVRRVTEPARHAANDGKWVHVVLLDTKHRLTAVERISGTLDNDAIRERVLRAAVMYPGTAAFILDLNFSGTEARMLAKQVAEGAQVVGVNLLDVLGSGYVSASSTMALQEGAWSELAGVAWDDGNQAAALSATVNDGEAVSSGETSQAAAAGQVARQQDLQLMTAERYDAGIDNAAGLLREPGAEYGAGNKGPDWEAFADLAQRVADFERQADRRVQIARTIERTVMTRQARDLRSLRRRMDTALRQSEQAKATATAATAGSVAAARAAFEAVVDRPASSMTDSLAALFREAVEQGRQKGRSQKTAADLPRMLREALNARVRRLMGTGETPMNWREVNAGVNRRMLEQLGQIEASVATVADGQERVAAMAAEVRRLFGMSREEYAALALGVAGGTVNAPALLIGARKALERDLRAYYRLELSHLFGGRATTKRLPNGRVIRTKTEGIARAGLSRMTPDTKAGMTALIAGIDFEGLSRLTWVELRSSVDRARELMAESALEQQAIADDHKTRRADASEAAAAEIEAAREPIAGTDVSDQKVGTLRQRRAFFTASQRTRALLLAGGNPGSVTSAVLGDSLLAANRRQLDLETADLRALDAKLTELGFTRDDLLGMDFQPTRVTLADGRLLAMTRGEMMTLYGMTLDADAAGKLVRNGWRPARWRHDGSQTIRGEGADYDARLEASEAIVAGVVSQLTPREKALTEWVVQERSREWASRGNVTSLAVGGVELFADQPHITLKSSIDREAELPDVDDPARGFGRHMVDRMGLTKERQSHTHPLLLRNLLSIYRMQARDMSVYTAWALPYRDAISLLSRGPAKSAVVSRWGTQALGVMKDALAMLTYQKGHTDHFNALQTFFAKWERNTATFILGGRLTSIALNRYGGALTLASRVASEGSVDGPAMAGRFLARAFKPVGGNARLRVTERRDAYERLLLDGYLFDRWHRSPLRVFAQLASQRMEVDEAGRAMTQAAKLRRRDRWTRFQQFMLSGMAKAEAGNGIDLYLTLRAAGWDEARAVEAISLWTRETQNPSTALEETSQYAAIRSAGLGIVMPFLGQPSVQWDLVHREFVKARGRLAGSRGRWSGFNWALAGAIAAAVFAVALRHVVRRAQEGLMDGDDDDERKKNLDQARALAALVGELSGAAMPGGEGVVDQFFNPLLAWVYKDKGIMPYGGGSDNGLAVQALSAAGGMGRAMLAIGEGKMTEEKAERLLMDLHRLAGAAVGLPTGGIEQGARVVAGLAGDPLGKQPPRAIMPPARAKKPKQYSYD